VLQRRTEPFPGRLILQVARAAQAGRAAGILLGRLVEQNPALGVHDCRHYECLTSPTVNPGKDPDVKTCACFCVILYGPVFCFSSTRNSPGAAGVSTRRFPLLPTATGRRCFGAPMLATESATTERCLSKGIPEPRPVAGMSAERDSFGLVMAGLVHLRQSFGGLIRESLAKPWRSRVPGYVLFCSRMLSECSSAEIAC